MAHEIKVPDLGDGVVGKILNIHVKVGDKINRDTIIADINTDKVDAEVPAEIEGEVVAVVAKIGSEARMGDVLISVNTGTKVENSVAKVEKAAPAPTVSNSGNSSEVELKVPDLGEGVVGKILSFNVKEGEVVSPDTIVASINTDKVDADVPAEMSGFVVKIVAKVGSEVKVGDVLMLISVEGSAQKAEPAVAVQQTPAQPATVAPQSTAPTAVSNSSIGKRSSPLARKLARELGVDLSQVSGDARISKLDVINHYARKQSPLGAASGSLNHKSMPDFSKFGTIRKEAMPRITEVTAENMTYSWSTIPHAWILEKVDITEVERLRNKHKEAVKAKGAGLTLTAIIAKAVAKALMKHPYVNASCDMQNKEIVFKEFANVGIAVDTPRGLLVPVIRDCEKKTIFEIAQELTELSNRTKEGKNKATDMEGGTFTISNVGGIGGSGILPLVNAPQGAILGVTGSEMEGVWNGERFEPRLRMQITIGFDHRIINGAEATRFLQTVKQNLEDPFLMNLY
jgi:pyruvate dehydrogenase E2 component (dihydrolipoamide acetyltransferase)